MRTKKRFLSLLLCGAMLFSLCSPSAFAEAQTVQDSGQATAAGGLCEHHTEHTEDCGYTEGEPGTPCNHEHTEDCYTEVTECVHQHNGDCYPEATDSVSGNTATPSNAEEREPENCAHVCSKESGCITEELNCKHKHTEDCGYVPNTEGTPCGFVCEICGAETVTVASVQAMIDALPEKITEDNAEDVKAQLEAIDKAKAQLSDEELNGLDFSRYQAVQNALAALDGQTGNDLPMPAADGAANIEEGAVTINACQGACPGHLITGTGTKTQNAITVNSGEHNITIENVNIEAADRRTAFDIKSGATVHLTLQENNSLKSGRYQAGLQVPAGATLVITAESTGDLTATGGKCCAGIGGGGNITINGGTVTAYGGKEIRSGAGIGGGYYLNGSDFKSGGGNITINGGTVNAYGGEEGAGIGGGEGGEGGTILITGGTVNAYGGRYGAGIGGGNSGAGGNITIEGGTVAATSGDSLWSGAGIGGGSSGAGGNITIKGGTVAATGRSGAGIGGGDGGAGGTIEISGGTVTAQSLRTVDGIGAGIGDGRNGTGGTFSTTESGTAIITATPNISDNGDTSQWNGIIFEGNSGGVYGDQELQKDLTLTGDQTLTIPDGSTLTVPNGKTFTNNGTLIDNGTLNNNGTLDNNKTLTIDGTLTNNGTLNNQGTINGNGKANPKLRQPDTQEGEGYSIDYATKKITIETDYTVEGFTTGDTIEPGTQIKCYKPENNLFEASKPAEFTTPALRNAPTVSINYDRESLNVTERGDIECSLNGTDWQGFGYWDFDDFGWNAGATEIKVYVRLKATGSDYASNPTGLITIPARPATPDVKGVAPTSAENKDGKITGVDTSMKYWSRTIYDTKNCPNGEITNLAPDVYLVWVGSTDNSFASEEVLVEVPSYEDATKYQVTVNNGNGNYTKAAEGWTVTVTADAAPDGQQFKNWTVTPDTVTVPNTSTASFIMPGEEVTLTANFEKKSTTHHVTVQNDGNGTASASPASAIAGTKITLSATANSGYHFQKWEVISNNVTINSDNSFSMPDANVTVKAVFEKDSDPPQPTEYSVTVQTEGSGNASAAPASAIAGTKITLTATASSGYHFQKWEVISGGVTINSDNSFTMPAANVTVKAIFEKDSDPSQPTEYTVTFNGNGGTSPAAQTTKGGKLTSLPTSIRDGYSLDGWYTAKAGGDKITLDTVFTASVTVYAQWTKNSSSGGSSGGGGGSSTTYYTLTFETNGGSAIEKVTGKSGKTIDLSGYLPTREGYDFNGWYSDKELTRKITEIRLNGNKTVYAGWTEHKTNPDTGAENPGTGAGNPFTDVKETDWFYKSVMFVYEKGLMAGTSATTFDPNSNATRAQLAVIFYRMEGSPNVEGRNSFTDVEYGPGTAWYYDAVTWAEQSGVVSGYGDGTFGPGNPVTREQLAAIFYRYAQYKGYDVTAAGSLDRFTDKDKVSEWAKQPLIWAVSSGIVNGTGDNQLSPQGTATRAQIAAMLQRFIGKYQLKPTTTPTGTTAWTDQTTPPADVKSPQTGDNGAAGAADTGATESTADTADMADVSYSQKLAANVASPLTDNNGGSISPWEVTGLCALPAALIVGTAAAVIIKRRRKTKAGTAA